MYKASNPRAKYMYEVFLCLIGWGVKSLRLTQLMTEQAEWIKETLVPPEQIFIDEPSLRSYMRQPRCWKRLRKDYRIFDKSMTFKPFSMSNDLTYVTLPGLIFDMASLLRAHWVWIINTFSWRYEIDKDTIVVVVDYWPLGSKQISHSLCIQSHMSWRSRT